MIRSVDSTDELHAANDLMAKVQMPDYYEAMRWIERVGAVYPGFEMHHTRVAYWNGELAGALRVTMDTIRIGEARLRSGGFGWVSTSGRHRHKGIARAMMEDTMKYMRDQRLHVSTLFGIPNFYHRFGFVTALAEYSTTVMTNDVVDPSRKKVRLRDGKPSHIPAMQKMHEASDTETACSIIRCGAHFHHNWEEWRLLQVVLNAQGRMLGYFLPKIEGETLVIREMGVLNRRLCPDLLQGCAQFARDYLAREIKFLAPPRHPLIEHLHGFQSRHEMQLMRGEGGMMALVNTLETLESMVPEWEQCLMESPDADLDAEVTLLVERKPYRVRASRGGIVIDEHTGSNKVSLSAGDCMHLLAGYRHLEDVLAEKRRILSPPGRHLLAVLFPKRTSYVWSMDRF